MKCPICNSTELIAGEIKESLLDNKRLGHPSFSPFEQPNQKSNIKYAIRCCNCSHIMLFVNKPEEWITKLHKDEHQNTSGKMQELHSMHRIYFGTAKKELERGKKDSHWMWYFFPQIQGLGHSYQSMKYSLSGIEETKEYLADDMLREDTVTLCKILLSLDTNNPKEIFWYPDDMKLRSSMTLFMNARPDIKVFWKILRKYYHGIQDGKTLQILRR